MRAFTNGMVVACVVLLVGCSDDSPAPSGTATSALTAPDSFLFDNLGVTPCCAGPIVQDFPFGDSFSTGPLSFELSTVTVFLHGESPTPPPSDLVITAVLLADNSTSPGAVLTTLGTLQESAVTFGDALYTMSGTSPFSLAPNTRYWIELTSNDTSLGFVEWRLSPDLTSTIGTAGEFWFAVNPPGTSVFPDGVNGGPLMMALSGVATVGIEIKPPASAPVPINPRARGRIPVAILSTPTFDAVTQVDPSSLTFGHNGDEASLAFCGSGEDVNGDGLPDLVCHFDSELCGFVAGDTIAFLNGQTGGQPFQGSEAIQTVPR